MEFFLVCQALLNDMSSVWSSGHLLVTVVPAAKQEGGARK